MTSIESELDRLPSETQATLAKHRFDRAWFLRCAAELSYGPLDNHVRGHIEPLRADEIQQLPELGGPAHAALTRLGDEALSHKKVALVVLAGGMATRMGGVVKALVEALPGKTFLELRLAEQHSLAERYGSRPPLWLMTSHATDAPIRSALKPHLDSTDDLAVFHQRIALRLTEKGELFRDSSGRVSEYSPGHGDLPQSLKDSGLLQRFVETGGEWLMLTNLDNLGGTLDPAVLGFHIQHGAKVTSEVVQKLGTDRGGIPARVDGHPLVLEEFRIPPSFDASSVGVFNINTFVVSARALLDLEYESRYFCVKKSVGDQKVIQFERLVNEITGVLPTRYLEVPRTGSDSRFLPVKDGDELSNRQSEIEAVARARGMLR